MATRKTPPSKAAKPAVRSAKTAKKTAPLASAKAGAKPAKPSPKTGAAKGAELGVGSRAPSFTLNDQTGKRVSSKELAGAPYVLYFYPKDDTSGCTKQACGFRDAFKGFGKLKARVIGVSPDSEASHERFAKKYGLPFTLLADPDKVLANAYGVWVKKQNYGREYMGILRSTFVVDARGTIQKAYRGVRVDGHVPAVLEAVQGLA
jgi:peroxiredoxin Q/BCP